MFKFLQVFALFVLLICCALFAQSSTTISNIIQPTGMIDGTTIAYTNYVYTIPGGKWAKAAELRFESDSGYLEVHLVKSGATTWYRMPLFPGMRTAALFDKIRSTKTTIEVDSCVLFLNE